MLHKDNAILTGRAKGKLKEINVFKTSQIYILFFLKHYFFLGSNSPIYRRCFGADAVRFEFGKVSEEIF